MKVLSTAFFVLVTLFALVPASTAQEAVPAQTDFVDDELLVKFIPGTPASEIAAAHQAAGGVVVRRVVALDVQVVKVSAGQAVQRLPLYQRNPNVQYAELNIIYQVADDPFYPSQWSLHNTGQLGGTADADIDAPEAWATGATGSGVKIAVVDTGIKKTHPEIGAAKVIAEIDYSTDGTVDDLHGHGTHVGSTAAGISSNGLGIHAIAPAAQLLNAKVLNSAGSGTCDSVANGITWAADNGAHVINLSLGGGACTTEENAVNYAWNLGVVLACAAGNNGNSGLFYPAAYPNCISVGATDRNDQKASFSNFGSTVDVGAPGVAIAAAIPGSSAEVTTSDFGLLTVTGAGVSQLERSATPLNFSETTSDAALQAQAVDAGLGAASDFAAVDCTGKIAVIQRGTDTFATKVTNAKNDDCVGAVIYNNVAGNFSGTLGSAGNWLPVVSISQADGQDLVSRIGAGPTLRMAVRNDYGSWDGTSMATPHVSGAAALVWAACGGPNSNVRALLENTGDRVAELGSYWAHGRINAASAVSGCGAPPPANTAPVANNVVTTTSEDTAVVVTLSGSDVETCDLAFSIVTGPGSGSLGAINNNPCAAGSPNTDSATVTYTPPANFSGLVSFTYKANDGTADSNTATVSITVNAVNDAPVANNQTVSTTAGTAVNITLTASDVETCELTFSVTTGPSNGILSAITDNACAAGNPNTDSRSVTYTPNGGFTGNDSFTFNVSDGALVSNTATVAITVNAVNQTPALNVTITMNNAPLPGDRARFSVTVTDASTGAFVSGATVTATLDTTDADTAPNYSSTKTTNTSGAASFNFRTKSSDGQPWTIGATANKSGFTNGSRTCTWNGSTLSCL